MSDEIQINSSRQRTKIPHARARETLERAGIKAQTEGYDDRAVDVAQLERRLKSFIEILPWPTRAMFGLANELLTKPRVAHRAGVGGGTSLSRVDLARLRFVRRINARIA